MRIRRIALSFIRNISVAVCLCVGIACVSDAAEKEMPWHEYYMNAEKAAQQKKLGERYHVVAKGDRKRTATGAV